MGEKKARSDLFPAFCIFCLGSARTGACEGWLGGRSSHTAAHLTAPASVGAKGADGRPHCGN